MVLGFLWIVKKQFDAMHHLPFLNRLKLGECESWTLWLRARLARLPIFGLSKFLFCWGGASILLVRGVSEVLFWDREGCNARAELFLVNLSSFCFGGGGFNRSVHKKIIKVLALRVLSSVRVLQILDWRLGGLGYLYFPKFSEAMHNHGPCLCYIFLSWRSLLVNNCVT